jgi:hypothetical protein
MRIRNTAVLLSSLSLLFSLSACKQPGSNKQPEAQEPMVSVLPAEVEKNEAKN